MPRSTSRAVVAVVLLAGLIGVAAWPAQGAGASAAAYDIGLESFEPTLGATANGHLFFSTTPSGGVAVGWRASVAKSVDGGASWRDIGPTLPTGHSNPPETNDPYIYVDPGTGRVFMFHMSPILTCSIMSWSDDEGETWTANPKGCSPTVIWDHQTIVAAKPRGVDTFGYPNVLHQCVNAIYAAMCATSLDGGLTWGPSVPAYANSEIPGGTGAQHGHLAAGPDGTVYLPTSFGGTRPMVYISDDDGLTWRQSVIADMDTPFVDPTVSVDSKGNLYAAFIDERGWLYYATSTDNGAKWSKAVPVAEGYTTNMPVIVADAPGKAVIAYPATDDLDKGYNTKNYLDGGQQDVQHVAWGANFTVTYNGLDAKPRFRTVVATGNDPIGRGRMCGRGTRCAYLIDFIEAIIGPDGRPYASFVDGCLDECSNDPIAPQKSGTGVGLLTTLKSWPSLCASVCWRYKGASKTALSISKAFSFATSPAQRRASREHARLSPQMRRLQREATQRRLEAVGR
jgi:hypothetical protein